MVRGLVIAVLAASAGAVGGAYWAHQRASEALAFSAEECRQAQARLAEQTRQTEALRTDLAELRAQAARFESSLASLSSPPATSSKVEEGSGPDTLDEPPPGEAEGPVPSSVTTPLPGRPRGDTRAADPGRDAGGDGRGEQTARARERLDQLFADEVARTADPAAQTRLSALNDSLDAVMELRRQMAEARTTEEREALRQNMAEAWANAGALLRDQQDAMLRDLADQYGVPAARQAQFVESIRQTQASPFFRGGALSPGGRLAGFMGLAPNADDGRDGRGAEQ